MQHLIRQAILTAFILLTGLCNIACAQSILADTYVAMNATATEVPDTRLPAVTNPAPLNTTVPRETAAEEFKAPWLTTSKTHRYLGIATLVSSMATALTAPNSCETNCSNKPAPTHGVHQTLGRTTGALALATVATGLMFHWKDMHLFEGGLTDPDNQHWLLAASGALIMADAISKAPAKNHAAQAEAGAVIMLIGVKLVW